MEDSLETVEVSTDTLIPVNASGSAVVEITSRFSSAIWYEKVQQQLITLAGCGGIGSYVGFLLGRLHPGALYLYDSDRVELGNLSGQFYKLEHIRDIKVYALSNFIRETSQFARIYSNPVKYTHDSKPTPIMICGFDNMKARKTFFEVWKSTINHVPDMPRLFIDGRLAAEEFQVFAFTQDNAAAIDRYEREFLFNDDEAEETICSYKQTSYMANMIGSVMVNIFINFCANQCDLILPREIPFLTTYRADYMEFKTERCD